MGHIRLAVVYRVCQHWRVPVFERLAQQPGIDFKLFHGTSVVGTKLLSEPGDARFARHELPTRVFHLRTSGRRVDVVFHPTIYSALRRFAPHVVAVEGGSNLPTNLLAYLYAHRYRRATIWWTLGELPGRRYSFAGTLYRRICAAFERRSTAVLGYSSRALRYFDTIGIPNSRQFRAVNVVDTERIQEGVTLDRHVATQLRESLGLGTSKVILFVGALSPGKSVEVLLDAVSQLPKDSVPWHLVLVGEGSLRGDLEQFAHARGISNRTTFVGRIVDGVGAYFELADVFVLPGLGGLAISEAMTHGLPIITSVGDGCEEDLVRDGENGFRILEPDEGDRARRIASLLAPMLSDDSRLRAMSARSLQIIRDEHNISAYVDAVLAAVAYAAAQRPA